MARIAGVDLPRTKRIEIGLTYIYGIGRVRSNIILTEAGPKVIDFGIARRQDTTAVTRTGMMIGSMGFMAPEQISGHPGPEADIFAWGVTVAYAATGRSPFGAGNTHSVLYRIMYGDADIASVPGSLLPLVESSLAKDPQSRPSARQLLDRLTSASRPENVHDSPTQVILARTWQSGSHPSPPAAPAAAVAPAGWPYAARPGAGSPAAAAAPAVADVTDAPTADSPSSAPPAGPTPAPEKVPVARRMATIAASALAAMRFRRSSRPADPKQ